MSVKNDFTFSFPVTLTKSSCATSLDFKFALPVTRDRSWLYRIWSFHDFSISSNLQAWDGGTDGCTNRRTGCNTSCSLLERASLKTGLRMLVRLGYVYISEQSRQWITVWHFIPSVGVSDHLLWCTVKSAACTHANVYTIAIAERRVTGRMDNTAID